MFVKKVKKVMTMLLTLCLMFTMFAGIQASVIAAEGDTIISYVDITGEVITPVAGNAIETSTIQGEGYTIELGWDVVVFDNAGMSQMKATGTFEKGNIYVLCGKLIAEEGYCFPIQASVSVMSDLGIEYLYCPDNEKETERGFLGYYSLAEQIEYIYLENVLAAEVGKTVENQTFEGNGYKAETSWAVQIDGSWEDLATGSVFEEGNRYVCRYEVAPTEGYSLADNCYIYSNGESVFSGTSYNPLCKYEELQYSFLPVIERVEFTNMPTASYGEKIVDTLTYEENVPYSVDSYWEANLLPIEADGVFGKDQYDYLIHLNSAECEFAEDLVFVIDGKEYPARHSWGDSAYIRFRYDFRDHYDTVEISGLPIIEAGDTTGNENITVPADAKYVIDEITWYDMSTENVFKGTFEDGKIYKLKVDIRSLDGYTWSTVYNEYEDGTYEYVPTVEFVYNGEHNAASVMEWIGGYIWIEAIYAPGAEAMNRVSIDVDTPVVGDSVPDFLNSLVVSEGCEITHADCYCFTTEAFEKTFEVGNRYAISLHIEALEGSVLADTEEMQFYFNGEKYRHAFFNDAAEMDAWIAFEITKDGSFVLSEESVVTDISAEEVQLAIENAEVSSTDVVEVVAKGADEVADVVTVDASILETVADAEKSLSIQLANAIVEMDAAALKSIASQLEEYDGNSKVALHVSNLSMDSLNEEQIAALEEKNPMAILSLNMRDAYSSTAITQFDGGLVTVKIPFIPEEGMEESDYSIAYVAKEGTVELIATTYADGYLVAELEHFSEYAIVKTVDFVKDNETDNENNDESANTDDGIKDTAGGSSNDLTNSNISNDISPDTSDVKPIFLYAYIWGGIATLIGVFCCRKRIMK